MAFMIDKHASVSILNTVRCIKKDTNFMFKISMLINYLKSESRSENRFKGSTIFQPYFDKKNSFILSKNVVDMSFGCILLI